MIETREPEAKTDELAHAVIGAAIEVHRHLGPDFLEEVYEEALCLELRLRQIPFERQKRVKVDYKGQYVVPPANVDRLRSTVAGELLTAGADSPRPVIHDEVGTSNPPPPSGTLPWRSWRFGG